MNKYYKNLILCGDIDFHCLVCEETFHYATDLDRHVRWESHRKKMKAYTYLPKFRGDQILKVGNLYYCETCNFILPTALKTSLHINDEKHIFNKEHSAENTSPKNQVIRDAGSIKISTNIVVNEKDWNGIVDDQCVICDKDCNDIESHITETQHVINLIQSKVDLQNPERAYRKIGADIFYCFVCKAPLPMSLLEKHWTSKEHSEKNKAISANTVNNGASTSGFSSEFKNNMKKLFVFSDASNRVNNTKAAAKGNSEIVSHLQEFKKGGIDINLEKSSAVCKVCKFSPAFTVSAIQGHIKMHKKAENDSPGFILPNVNDFLNNSDLVDDNDDDDDWTTEESDDESDFDSFDSIGGDTIVDEEDEKENNFTGSVSDFVKMKAELKSFGKKHDMKLVADDTKGYCILCDTYVSAHVKNFNQHVKGIRHVSNTRAKNRSNANQQPNGNKQEEYKTKTLRDWLRNIFFVKQMDDFWINRKFCIDKHSFFNVCVQDENGGNGKMKCFVCNDVFPIDKDQAHCERTEHRNKMFSTKMVISLKGEFVREIRANIFHCGFCNKVVDGWELMKKHLKTNKHREFREQQKLVADMTDDMYGMHMEDTNSAETDIMWMSLMGNRLF